MRYVDFDKSLDFYNYNLSKEYSVDFNFSVVPTTFEYGFLLIPNSAYAITQKDDKKTIEIKNLLWKYISNWNCIPDENTYTEITNRDIFFERMLEKNYVHQRMKKN